MTMWRRELTPLLRGCQLLLDLGAGTGRFRSTLESIVGGAIVELDSSIEMSRKNQARPSTYRVPIVVGKAEFLPFRSCVFSHVFGSAVLHHLDIPQAFAELRRVLQDNGSAIFRGTIRDDLADHPLGPWFPSWVEVEAAKLNSLESIQRHANRHGFEVGQVRRISEVVADTLGEYVQKVSLRGVHSLRQLSEPEFRLGLQAMADRAAEDTAQQEVRMPVTLIVLRRRV